MPAPTPDRETYRPVFFEPGSADLERLATGQGVIVHDTIAQQLGELVATKSPKIEWDAARRARAVDEHLAGRSPAEYGTWAYFPWSRRLVHLLPQDEFRFVRASRNRYKISADEDALLRTKTVGVVGLSVGMASAVTLAMEGVGGAFRLADFDVLDLSNMNRLRAGVHDVGVPKTVLAARAMLEIDPFLDVTTFPKGLDDDVAEAFLRGLDLLVEECDDLFMKVRVRERARALRIPVVMETSDRGLLDVERFDLEPERPILHGLLGSVSSERLRGLTTKEKVPYVLRIIDERAISTALAASLVEVKQSIPTWPQLASAVALGGAVVTDTARRVLLGSLRVSGRFYVDLDRIVSKGGIATLPEPAPLEPVITPEAATARTIAPPRVGAAGEPISRDEIRWLVAHATLAPSGGNAQPWWFEARGAKLLGWIDDAAPPSYLDFERSATQLALGAAAENLDLAARTIGIVPEFGVFPEPARPTLAFVATLRRGVAAAPPAFAHVTARVTNRRLAERTPLTPDDRRGLVDAAASRGARLALVEDPSALERLGRILGRGDRLRFLCAPLHRELVSELRFDPEEVLRTRTGVDVATLELGVSDAAAMRVLASWPAMERLRALGAGAALTEAAEKTMRASSAVGVLSIDRGGPRAFFEGGRTLEHVWLEATARGLAFQPYAPLLYLFRRVEGGGARELAAEDVAELRALEADLRGVVDWGRATPLMLFRLARVGPPTARSLRKPLDAVLRFVDA